MVNTVVIHRIHREHEDQFVGVYRPHYYGAYACWCSPLVLHSDDKKFLDKINNGLVGDADYIVAFADEGEPPKGGEGEVDGERDSC